jgi:hypothetical protein
MSTFTHAIKRLFATSDRPAPRPAPAALIEAVEARRLMSATLTPDAPAPAPATTDPAPVSVARKAGKGQQEYLIFVMKDVIVTSVTPGSSGGDGSA